MHLLSTILSFSALGPKVENTTLYIEKDNIDHGIAEKGGADPEVEEGGSTYRVGLKWSCGTRIALFFFFFFLCTYNAQQGR